MKKISCEEVKDFWENPTGVKSFLEYRKHVNSCLQCRQEFRNNVLCAEVVNDTLACFRIYYHETALTMWAVCIMKGVAADHETPFGAIKEIKDRINSESEDIIFILPNYKKRRQQFIFVSSKKMECPPGEGIFPQEMRDFFSLIADSMVKVAETMKRKT